MVTEITQGVKISVNTAYQPEYSNPLNDHYIFSYHITIENLTDTTFKLMRRHWFIFDSSGDHREVEGEGVIGLQPVIEPGNKHEYMSGCNLTTDMGSMEGFYQMKLIDTGEQISVRIPRFNLIADYRLN